MTILLPYTCQPYQGIKFSLADIFIIPFSVVWFGMAAVIGVVIYTSDAPIFARLFILPFLLVGLYITVGRFFVDKWRRRRTKYVIQEDRIELTFGNRTDVIGIGDWSCLKLEGHKDGRGTIWFGEVSWLPGGASGFAPVGLMLPKNCLYQIDDAREVHKKLRELAKV